MARRGGLGKSLTEIIPGTVRSMPTRAAGAARSSAAPSSAWRSEELLDRAGDDTTEGDMGAERRGNERTPLVVARADSPAGGARSDARDIDVSEPGIGRIYNLLDDLVARHRLDDAWVVLDDPAIGRQIFRRGRLPIADHEVDILDAPVGLHTLPPLADGLVDESSLLSIASLALALDVTRYEAGHDSLTGLLGRRRFDEELEGAAARSDRHGWRFCLAILDLDSLKQINDEHGHAAGDAILADLGGRLRARLRVGDVAARIGGDEFALILPGIDADAVPALLERVRDGADAAVSFTAGVAECPEDTTDLRALVEIADERLRSAKRRRQRR